MKLSAEQLQAWLRKADKRLPPLIWVAGDEPLLCQEACDLLRHRARALEYAEREVHHVDRQFDWQLLSHSTRNLSLFAQRRLIELRLTAGKLDEAGRKALLRHVNDAADEVLILVSSPRLDAAVSRSKWFQQLEAAAAVVQVWPVDAAHMPAWLARRLQSKGLKADAEVISLLCDRTQGNLLAAAQEIEKLLLSSHQHNGHITVESVHYSVADSARFNVFELIDHALLGEAAAARRSLQGLLAEGSEPLLILAMVCRELRALNRMLQAMARGQRSGAVMKSERIRPGRQQAVAAALARLNTTKVYQLLRQAREVDLAVKGRHLLPPALILERLLLTLSGIDLRSPSAPAWQPVHA